MSRPNDIPAFPTHNSCNAYGMTLRDWLAGQALCGFMTVPVMHNPDWYAEQCYKLADAMLEQRSKE